MVTDDEYHAALQRAFGPEKYFEKLQEHRSALAQSQRRDSLQRVIATALFGIVGLAILISIIA